MVMKSYLSFFVSTAFWIYVLILLIAVPPYLCTSIYHKHHAAKRDSHRLRRVLYTSRSNLRVFPYWAGSHVENFGLLKKEPFWG